LESSRDSEVYGDLLGDSYVGKCGDEVKTKQETTLRIGFQNVGGFPAKRGQFKEDIIQQGLIKWEFNIFGMAEMNLDW
jgi:hypothetical protein